MLRLSRFSTPRFFGALALCVCVGIVAGVRPAEALRVVSYNLLNYDNQNIARDPSFRTVMSNIGGADIVAVQEVQDQAAMNNFLNNVLNVVEPGQWAIAPFFNDPVQSFNQGMFYRPSTVSVISSNSLGNSPRDISFYTVRPVGYTSSDAEMTLFITHFKAGSSSSDQSTRLIEAQNLRSFMNTNYPDGTNMMVVGDFNMRSSFESAYVQMTGSQADNSGRVQDPINSPGTWNNSFTFAPIHTQSTRTVNLGDGGATGGMDDRFDFILPTFSLADGEGLDQLAGTYDAFGQDGNHFNANINDVPTIPEGAAVANALQAASDHLPVVLDFQVPAVVSADASLDFGTVIIGATADQTLNVSNGAADPADELDYTLSAPAGFTAPGGGFQDPAGGGGNVHTISMDTATDGAKGGTLTVDSDDVDNPSANVTLSGTVLRHADPSLAAGSPLLADTLDFGAHDEGAFAPDSVSVSNLNYDALQALLNVHDATITGGDGRFSLSGGFSPTDVGGTAAFFTVLFADSGAARSSDTTYTATLVFSTRDEQGIPGATDLSDLTVTLSATVNASTTTAVGDLPGLGATLLGANFPNPFRSGTAIHFELESGVSVALKIYDVQGRLVRTLVDGWLDRGAHDRAWDGVTDAGGEARPGVYFYRLEIPGFSDTRRMTKLN